MKLVHIFAGATNKPGDKGPFTALCGHVRKKAWPKATPKRAVVCFTCYTKGQEIWRNSSKQKQDMYNELVEKHNALVREANQHTLQVQNFFDTYMGLTKPNVPELKANLRDWTVRLKQSKWKTDKTEHNKRAGTWSVSATWSPKKGMQNRERKQRTEHQRGKAKRS